MKIRSLLALAGLAIGLALPVVGQQKDTADRRLVQQRDLLGSPSSLAEFGELSQKLDEAYNKNDAAAVAALFTQDALLVTPDGMFNGEYHIPYGTLLNRSYREQWRVAQIQSSLVSPK
jgi:hypothetical protein